MRKNKKQKFIKFIMPLAIFLAFFVFSFGAIAADETSGVKKAQDGLKAAADKGYGAGDIGSSGIMTSIPTAIGRIVGAALAFIGVLFFVLMVYGGLLWMTARGNESQVEKAKNLIQAAIIGLIIVLSAYVITSYVGNLLLNSDSSAGGVL